jgi:hypothetical protein
VTAELGGFRANPDTTKKSWDEFVRCLPKTSPWRSSGSRIVAREHGLSVTGQGDTQSASALASAALRISTELTFFFSINFSSSRLSLVIGINKPKGISFNLNHNPIFLVNQLPSRLLAGCIRLYHYSFIGRIWKAE